MYAWVVRETKYILTLPTVIHCTGIIIIIIGSTARDTVYLVNTEDKQYHFTINENSCCSDDRRAKLKVSPMSGSILPNSK